MTIVLVEEYFTATGSAKYFRNACIKPEDSIAIIEIDKKGENYRICWGLVNEGYTANGLPYHLMNHEVKPQNYRDLAIDFKVTLPGNYYTRNNFEQA